MNLLDNPTRYRLPWSRFLNASEWMRAEVVATSFDAATGKPTKWCVREGESVLNKDEGDWECEPTPSSRDAEFLERTRWNTASEAAEAARRYFAPTEKA